MYITLSLIYVLGMLAWIGLWYQAKGFGLARANPLLYVPFILVLFILLAQPIVAFLYTIDIGTVSSELALIKIVESNTLQLIQSNVGVLIVAPIIISLIGKSVPKDFIVFQALSIVFIAGGVLPIYWTPSNDGVFLYYLRHIKTLPYTIGIGCLMTGVIILLHHLVVSRETEDEPHKTLGPAAKKDDQ